MWKVLFRARDRFDRDQRGNVAVLFAVSAVPLIGLLGGAVDLTRHHRHKVELLNAMDSAAIALAKRGAEDDADADAFVNDYIAALRPSARKDPMLHVDGFDATEIEGGWRVESDAYMDTAFMPVIGISTLPFDISTEVMTTGGNYEIALALDNTGSMAYHGRIEALRDAAGQLVDDLYSETGADERVKMALVPFVTAVNIKGEAFDPSWIEPSGDHAVFGVNFSEPVNRLDLFEQMGVEWRGCVEARAEPYDEDDTPPTDAATRWVPFLWPDEPDTGSWFSSYRNSYLDDAGPGADWQRLRNVEKYDVDSGTRVADSTRFGPNAGCPRPIVELTNDQGRMHAEIDRMRPHNGRGESNHTGTNVAQGLLWAWRVLSPESPFEQGVPYEDEETAKVVVLLSDGRNQVVAHSNRVTQSDYTSYGFLAAGRLGYRHAAQYELAEGTVDDKVSRVCEKIKANGIRLYTILFEVDFARTQDIFRDCASKGEDGQPLYYYVPAPEQLAGAFSNIGKDLTTLRITR